MEMTIMTEKDILFGDEPYMSEKQLVYFKNKLICLKMELLEKIIQNKEKMKETKSNHADIIDRSNSVSDIDHLLRNQERNSRLIRQVDAALRCIDDGSFGYCKITGDRIGLKRLEALPFATVSIEAINRIDEDRYKTA